MKSAVKAFAVISGTALIAFGGNKLLNMHHTHRQVPTGTFIYERNANCNLSGRDYQGCIIGNRNANISCEETSIELIDSRNINFSAFSSTVRAIKQSNCKLLARASNIEMENDNNIDIEAEDVWCKFEDNKNLSFRGKGGLNEFLSQFVGNRNGKFRGKGNNILAFNNNNLMIDGDNNHLEISNTRNHDIRPAPLESNGNTLTIKTSGRNNIQFIIEYVGVAVIKEHKYQLGIINFDVKENSEMVNVTLHETEDVIYSIVHSSSSKLVVKAEKNGVIQTLELNGERVDAVALNSVNIFVNSV